ncbi:hypothetical protein TELCIR_00081 [Teladorsagia circumcincta]|uniref:Uncharacterized protein n=1 Tax=Teladorsagia circumcincta TaxID=45464 RepID=A0A2G9V5R1_TELCI|nr:hypothetical protein TELCIR_00081 [Teladorsagia circumcincta]
MTYQVKDRRIRRRSAPAPAPPAGAPSEPPVAAKLAAAAARVPAALAGVDAARDNGFLVVALVVGCVLGLLLEAGPGADCLAPPAAPPAAELFVADAPASCVPARAEFGPELAAFAPDFFASGPVVSRVSVSVPLRSAPAFAPAPPVIVRAVVVPAPPAGEATNWSVVKTSVALIPSSSVHFTPSDVLSLVPLPPSGAYRDEEILWIASEKNKDSKKKKFKKRKERTRITNESKKEGRTTGRVRVVLKYKSIKDATGCDGIVED